MRRLRVYPLVLVPGACLTALLGVSAVSVIRLARPVAFPTAAVTVRESLQQVQALAVRTKPVTGELTAAVAADPFRAERRPSPVSFRMPGEPLAGTGTNQPEILQAIVLIGTAVQDGGGFAMCQIGSEPARLVRLGERLAGYTLRAVGQGRATFRSATGQLIEVRVARTGT